MAAFASKLNDAESEAAETQTHIEIALRCGYVSPEVASEVSRRSDEILLQLSSMIEHAENWCQGVSADPNPIRTPRPPR